MKAEPSPGWPKRRACLLRTPHPLHARKGRPTAPTRRFVARGSTGAARLLVAARSQREAAIAITGPRGLGEIIRQEEQAEFLRRAGERRLDGSFSEGAHTHQRKPSEALGRGRGVSRSKKGRLRI